MKKNIQVGVVSSLLALALGGCGGSSGEDTASDGSGGAGGDTPVSFDLMQSDFDDLIATYDPSYPATALSLIPATGGATYAGTAVYSDVETDPNLIIANPDAASRVVLDADFLNAQMSGRLYEFASSNPDVEIDGELVILDGQIVNNLFDGDIDGSLDIDGTATEYGGGELLGAFLGSQLEAVSGRIFQGTSPTQYNGVFVGER